MIQNIEISKLSPHKDNPRKDLGDITELAESIKVNGIFQNLTVVPYIGEVTGEPMEGLYRVVIGHRRLAAAKLAGLTEVPCAISNMGYREQIATMLLENMQRSDLTIYEQAEGFQMMLNLGESIDGISQKTGFSETTVRRRVKLLDLDKDKFKKSVERGATIMDYVELEKIKDVELRNEVLEKIGTSNFNWELRNALDKEKGNENKARIVEQLKKFATEIKDDNDFSYVRNYYPSDNSDVVVPEDANIVKYYFLVPKYGPIHLVKEMSAEELEHEKADEANEDAERNQLEQRRESLEYVSNQAHTMRREFVKGLTNGIASKNLKHAIWPFITETLRMCYVTSPKTNDFADFLDVDPAEDGKVDVDELSDIVQDAPELAMLTYIYLALEVGGNYYNWQCKYIPNSRLDKIYDLLDRLGYEMSDNEKALQDGTHSLFLAKEAGESS